MLINNDYTKVLQKNYRANETNVIVQLKDYLLEYSHILNNIEQISIQQASAYRNKKLKAYSIDNIMSKYPLSSKEGLAIMGLAESLIRTKDKQTRYQLLADKITNRNWKISSGNLLMVFYGLGLNLCKIILKNYYKKPSILHKIFLPIIDFFTKIIIQQIAKQFVIAENIKLAVKKTIKHNTGNFSYSFDMLGEAARTNLDAIKYYNDYKECINTISLQSTNNKKLYSVSVKLSSLSPLFSPFYIDDNFNDIFSKILELCKLSAKHNIELFIDAEEASTTEFFMKIICNLIIHPELQNWQGLGIVVQAYQKRAFDIIDIIYNTCKSNNKKVLVRLVKGAYWDSEIKQDQINGIDNFSVFTRKEHTDISYMACVKKLSLYSSVIKPCFATHNLHTINFVKEVMKFQRHSYEFQGLFGMGEDAYNISNTKVRLYTPVGTFKNLLPYLVRRLLENSAKSNFVSAIINPKISIVNLLQNPIEKAAMHGFSMHNLIHRAKDIFLKDGRHNSQGLDMTNYEINNNLSNNVKNAKLLSNVFSIINGKDVKTNNKHNILNPSNNNTIANAFYATEQDIDEAINSANLAYVDWNKQKGNNRAAILFKVADKLEEKTTELTSILVHEAGKTLKDSILEIREAVDFLRYYAHQAQQEFEKPILLPSVDGEHNYLVLEGRGVFFCISPWNFPLAIFVGQISAALAAGNTVIAKPAESTNMIAYVTIKLFLEAGVPNNVLHLVLGEGLFVGNYVLNHNKLTGGVVFTGSEITAKYINKTLANRNGAILPLIAETGGQNCMIVDTSALAEQVVKDIVTASFQSAGQRCSALRVLYLPEETANSIIEMIAGTADLLNVAESWKISTDVGPIINKNALENLINHKNNFIKTHKLLFEKKISPNNGNFFAPIMFEINNINNLEKEIFGPCLHIIKYKQEDLDNIIKQINSTQYGLTFAVHSRIDSKINNIVENINAGNIYVNRNQIGAVVGSQPFGGRGKSGTGPKAGGPLYLHKFATEKTITIDVTAAGGNIDLLSKI